VYRKLNGISHGGSSSGGVYVYTSWLASASHVENLICSRCGYFESYIVDEKKMAEITNTWEKLG
jgi:hypothetical protein